MIWIIILIIVLVIIISFALSLNEDTKELKLIKLDQKFGVIVAILNKNLLDSHGQINNIDERAFNLYYNNKIIQFMYGTGNLNITYSHNLLGEEIVCQKLFDNLRDTSLKKQELIAQEFLNYVDRKIYAYKALNKTTDFKVEKRNDEMIKFKINSMFYDFCFSPDIAKIFLNLNDSKETIVKGLLMRHFSKQTILEGIFKKFIENKYAFNLGESSSNFYRVDGLRFFLDTRRIFFNNESYFEILYNDLKEVKNNENDEVTRAEEFIVFCKNNFPYAIFVTLYDPIVGKFAVRRVYENGTSIKLTFLNSNENLDAVDYIKSYITSNPI